MVISLSGGNHYSLKKRLDQLVADFIKSYGELALERFDGEEVDPQLIIDALQGVSFLSEKKTVLVRNFGQNKAAVEKLENILAAAQGESNLILYETVLDKRGSYYKTLKKSGNLEEFEELNERQSVPWLVDYAKSKGGQISLSDANYLVQRVGANQMLLASEVDKLLNSEKIITKELIDELTEPTPQSKIFDLMDAAFGGNKKKALELYSDQRAQKVEPQLIIGMIAWQLQNILICKTAAGMSASQIAKEAGMSPFVVQKSLGLASRISGPKLKELVSEIFEIDYMSKTSALDLDEALKNYLISI